jgi:hypothetical protein
MAKEHKFSENLEGPQNTRHQKHDTNNAPYEDPQILGVTIQNSVATAICGSGFVYACDIGTFLSRMLGTWHFP